MNTHAPYAGFFRRAAAFVIDMMLVSIPAGLASWLLLALQTNSIQEIADPQAQLLSIIGLIGLVLIVRAFVFLVTYWLYFALLESSRKQATLGKMLLKIKVVDYQGNRLSFGRASGRTFARILSQLTVQIGFVMAAFTHRKRALHDMIAKTYVVDKSFQPGSELPDTANHPVWLAVCSALLVAFAIYGSMFYISQAKTDMAVQMAALQLQQLNKTQQMPPKEPTANGTRYFRHADGYRALVGANTGISLFLPNDSDMICCEENEENSCEKWGLPICQ